MTTGCTNGRLIDILAPLAADDSSSRLRMYIEMLEQGAIRKRVRYSGHVQGVGFRYSTLAIAKNYPVTGYVRNLADGQVELVAEGSAEQVEAFLLDVSTRMESYIADAQTSSLPSTGSFSGFEITF